MTDLENLLELLGSWLDMHRQSILDGTVTCKHCFALVLEEHKTRHEAWHRANGQ